MFKTSLTKRKTERQTPSEKSESDERINYYVPIPVFINCVQRRLFLFYSVNHHSCYKLICRKSAFLRQNLKSACA